ncbi:hypothetical protein DCCM_2650 [Desulfocucumis palustris]|uniref:Uncharacterized protein n=1 Tax=Desulfocucumis palustris TaxID=1898651 RepID=A0A2L2XBG2_9FIRM|nr:hypothetical protein DCCM_2650 [Desulfocucumis palustris]
MRESHRSGTLSPLCLVIFGGKFPGIYGTGFRRRFLENAGSIIHDI